MLFYRCKEKEVIPMTWVPAPLYKALREKSLGTERRHNAWQVKPLHKVSPSHCGVYIYSAAKICRTQKGAAKQGKRGTRKDVGYQEWGIALDCWDERQSRAIFFSVLRQSRLGIMAIRAAESHPVRNIVQAALPGKFSKVTFCKSTIISPPPA